MVKRLLLLTIILFLSQITAVFSQINVGAVDSGPYTPGSSIALTFTTGATCIQPGNRFDLFLVRSDGTEIPGSIGSYNGFYAAFVNGVIPAGTPAGLGYRLRVRSTAPILLSADSDPFEIRAGTVADPILNSETKLSEAPRTFGLCEADENTSNDFEFTNESSTGNVVVTITNATTPTTTATITFTTTGSNSYQNFTAEKTHYTMVAKAVMPDGSVGTKAYFLINNPVITAFETSGGITVCFPTGRFEYSVGQNIRLNFPGNVYRIDWGDGSTPNEYTICDIVNGNFNVSHLFTRSSCGMQYTSGSQTFYNAFAVNVGVVSPFCNEIGRPLSSPARVVSRPINSFDAPEVACLGNVTFTNTSVAGDNPNNNSPGCTPSTMRYNWFVNGVPAGNTVNLTYNFTTTGEYVVRLVSVAVGGACQAEPFERRICIQNPPQPSFTVPALPICLTQGTLTPVNTSVLDNSCSGATPIYTWTVTGPAAVTYIGGTNVNSPVPQFRFTEIGRYRISLSIQSGSCQITSTEQEVIVDGQPAAQVSPEANICQTGALTFDPTTSITRTLITGTLDNPTSLPDTYTWEVLGTGAYNFVAPSTANSKYPTINFANYGTYTVRLTVKNSCNTVTVSQIINIFESPVPVITADLNPICHEATVNLTGSTGGASNLPLVWDNGSNSIGFSSPNSLTTTYTPSAAERLTGRATVYFRVSTGLTGSCSEVIDSVVITILPENTLSNTENSKTICTGNPVDFLPTSVSATSFSWTATNADGLINNLVTSGTGDISSVLTNTSNTISATVVYTITPSNGICIGEPFVLTVTVTPRPIISTPVVDKTICNNTSSAINVTSNIQTRFIWTSVASPGIRGATNPPDLSAPSGNIVINDNLINDTNTQGTVTYTIRAFSSENCDGNTVVVTIRIDPAITNANAGPDQELCNVTTPTTIVRLNADPNLKTGEIGRWVMVSNTPNASVDLPTDPSSAISGITPGQTYRFAWVISGPATCGTTTDTVTIVNNNPINQSISSNAPVVCSGQIVTINGGITTGGNGNYVYSWEIQENNGSWNVIPNESQQNLTIQLNTQGTIAIRRRVTSGGCISVSNEDLITVRPPITNNYIGTDQTICDGETPVELTGTTPGGGDNTFTFQWQSSTNGTVWTNISGANFVDYQPLAIPVTTHYRRNTSTAACGDLANPSNIVTITVNPPAIAEFTFASLTGCAPFSPIITTVVNVQRNATYTWYADNVVIGNSSTFPTNFSINEANRRVRIKLVTTSALNCNSDSLEYDFSTNQDVPAQFTQSTTEACGPAPVSFVNQSNQTLGATFRWNFGNGQLSNEANPQTVTYQPDPSGKDTTYVVTLYSITSCGIDSIQSTVLIKSPPRPIFSPSVTTGCSELTVNFTNNSPLQTNITYTFNFGDGTQPVETTDRRTVTHIYRTTTNTQTFNATLTARNDCGVVTTLPYAIVVRPNTVVAELVVNGNQLRGCAPFTVTFDNNSTGATDFIVDFGDGTPPRPSTSFPEKFTHMFTTAGTFTVTLTATNGCSTRTTSETITVLPQPIVDFTADQTLGCTGLAVQFRNTPQNGVSYIWDFGDGSPTSTEVEPIHVYSGTQEYYTVTLTATNALGCPITVSKNQFIRIVPPPAAAFNVAPSTIINIPDYTFYFQDESTNNPTIWEWDFGDGTTSTLRNPNHTYPDTGTYRVTLRALNQHGCFTSTFKNVTIKGVPGYLFVPNAFTPGDIRPELREFGAKGSGILSWKFGIFNKWGQLLWETTKLEEGRPIERWDGTYKGAPLPQGVYYWKIDVKMVNGTEWKGMTYDSSPPKRTGPIHLIR